MLARAIAVSEFTVNVVTLLGLGLAVDYSLLVLARFREERAADPDAAPADLLERTTRARAARCSSPGWRSGIALAALYVFADPLLSAMALGGALAVATATVAGLTLVPALIAVAHGGIPAPGTRTWVWRRGRPGSGAAGAARRLRPAPPGAGRADRDRGAARALRPRVRLDAANADARSLPAERRGAAGAGAVERDFSAGPVDPIDVLIEAPARRAAL